MKKTHAARPKKPTSGYKWVKMNAPLAFPVKCGRSVVLEAGTENVWIAFRQSGLTRVDEATGATVRLNVYWHAGRTYHGC